MNNTQIIGIIMLVAIMAWGSHREIKRYGSEIFLLTLWDVVKTLGFAVLTTFIIILIVKPFFSLPTN